jgi:hypothetical protein
MEVKQGKLIRFDRKEDFSEPQSRALGLCEQFLAEENGLRPSISPAWL